MENSQSKRKRIRIDVEGFIEEVRKYDVLYDKSKKHFKNTEYKTMIWDMIGQKFGLSATEAHRRWDIQRDRYSKKNKRTRESRVSGSGREDAYTPSWTLFDLMDNILRNARDDGSEVTVTNIDTEGNLASQLNITENEDAEEYEHDSFACSISEEVWAQIPKHSCPEETHTQMPDHNYAEETVEGECPSTSRESSSHSSTPNRPTTFEDSRKVLYETSRELIKYLNVRQQPDKITKFCDYLLERLRGLDNQDQKIAIVQIEKLMADLEFQEKYLKQ